MNSRITRGAIVCAAVLLALPATALAHGGEHPHEGPWWLAWNWSPLPMLGITLAGVSYGVGLTRLWRRAGVGHGVRRWQLACFAGGLVVLVLSLLSPIATVSGELGWVHMIQHTLLMLVAAPLLVAGSPGVVAAWAVPGRSRLTLARTWSAYRLRELTRYALWHPVALWMAFAVVLWVWHLPRLYDLALRNDLVHDAQHLAFLLSSCLYWRLLLDPVGRVRLTPPAGLAYLFTTSLHAMLLGVFMALAQQTWYPTYERTVPRWGYTALEDQQIAGYIMWMPACAIYAAVAAAILGVWLRESQKRDILEPDAAPPLRRQALSP